MNASQAKALAEIDQGAAQYTKGVLYALGHAKVFDEWQAARIGLELALEDVCAAEDAATQPGEPITFESLLVEVDPALTQKLDAQRARVNATWAPIQALKDQALAALQSADPFGMGQAS